MWLMKRTIVDGWDTNKAMEEATLLGLRARLGLSFVLVTHDLAQANRLADSFLQLDQGCVVDAG